VMSSPMTATRGRADRARAVLVLHGLARALTARPGRTAAGIPAADARNCENSGQPRRPTSTNALRRRLLLWADEICRATSMTDLLPPCPKCISTYTYADDGKFVCPECAHEWTAQTVETPSDDAAIYKDANGNVLVDGDSVTVIKDLKVKGASSVLKAGTKVKGIRLVEGDHNIDCRIDGFGAMKLKSEFVRKA